MSPDIDKDVPYEAKSLLVENHWIKEIVVSCAELLLFLGAMQINEQQHYLNVRHIFPFLLYIIEFLCMVNFKNFYVLHLCVCVWYRCFVSDIGKRWRG